MADFGLRKIAGLGAAMLLASCVSNPSALDASGYSVRSVVPPPAPTPALAAVDDGHEKTLFETGCGGCHGLDVVTGQQMSRTAWATTVDQMVDRGAPLDQDQAAQVADYLARHYGAG